MIRGSSGNHQVLILPRRRGGAETDRRGRLVSPLRKGDTDMTDRTLAILAAVSIAATGMPALAAHPGPDSHAPAVAGREEPLPSREVSYADLDLSNPAGMKTLDMRIAGAVETLCPEPEVRSMDAIADMQHCRRTARDSVRLQVQAAIDGATRLAAIRRPTQLSSR
jgi:UrcA family protein